ncbi:hypothetical protein [Cellulomonas fimi]|uniref:Uncharacterized protein n=1 Tax=Cellulomonas fimi TaxID=1708 RepID=A0A7Y0LZP3_CELFI|nr:hypothetical protein [Cellulomonas fimi]NMR20383.1 hypothetical protein [Cellulomonas fimi]
MNDTIRPSDEPEAARPGGSEPTAAAHAGPHGHHAAHEHAAPQEGDAALERLRASDPAVGAEPDTRSLDAAVRSRVASPPAAERPVAGTTDELAVARARRGRSRWVPAAAVAAGALVFGSAGYALGSAGEDETPSAAPAITLQGMTAGAAPSQALGAPEAATDAAARSSMIAPWYGGRTVFTAAGLSGEGGTADGWAFDGASVFSAETAERVAQALGVSGSAELRFGSWAVGPDDGTGASLQLMPDGTASVSYYDPTLDPYACPQPTGEGPTRSDGSGTSGSTEGSAGSAEPAAPEMVPVPVPVPEPGRECLDSAALGDAPQGDAAVSRFRELLASVGVDPDAYQYETGDSGMRELSYVTANQVVDEQLSGTAWSVTFVGDGVQSLYGSLAPLVPLGAYDVVSPAEAAERLMDPRFGATTGGPIMYAARGGVTLEGAITELDTGTSSAASEPAPATDPTVPPTVAPGSALRWPVTEVTLTSSRLGLTLYTQPDGATVLVPAYELSSDDGGTWSVIAVAESQLDLAPAR